MTKKNYESKYIYRFAYPNVETLQVYLKPFIKDFTKKKQYENLISTDSFGIRIDITEDKHIYVESYKEAMSYLTKMRRHNVIDNQVRPNSEFRLSGKYVFEYPFPTDNFKLLYPEVRIISQYFDSKEDFVNKLFKSNENQNKCHFITLTDNILTFHSQTHALKHLRKSH
jgi:hypothetical protein